MAGKPGSFLAAYWGAIMIAMLILMPSSAETTRPYLGRRACRTPPIIASEHELNLALIRLADRYRIDRGELRNMSLERRDFSQESMRILESIFQRVETQDLRLPEPDLRLIRLLQQTVMADSFGYFDPYRPWIHSIEQFYPLQETLITHSRELDAITDHYNLSSETDQKNHSSIQLNPRIKFAVKLNKSMDQLTEFFEVGIPTDWNSTYRITFNNLQKFYSAELSYLRASTYTPEISRSCQEMGPR
jgi:hypothetical protein